MAGPQLPHRFFYSYQPLPNQRSFRLLRFCNFRENRLCELITFDIEDYPPFSALSYTWGSPLNTPKSVEDYAPGTSKLFIIKTDSGPKSLSILKNLYDALDQLAGSSDKPQWIWVDAICINQEDVKERETQVTLMGDVYSSCTEVIVWLGKDESNLDDFKWLHAAFLPALWQYGEVNGQNSILKNTWTLELIQQRLKLDTTNAWVSYAKFYEERRWFSRAWVLQELTLAPRVMVLAGRSRLDWDEMSALANILSMNGLGLLLQKSLPPSNRDSRQVIGFECLRLHTFRTLFHKPSSLDYPLALSRSSRSSTWKSFGSTESSASTADSQVSMTITDTSKSKRLSEMTKGLSKKGLNAVRETSNNHIPQITKLFASTRSPKLNSWQSMRTWSHTMKSKFHYIYHTDTLSNRAEATGFSQWTTALIDNLNPSSDPLDRWNMIFLCCCQWVRYFSATKLHDKIYGVLGMIDFLRPDGVPPPACLLPDYSKSVEEIYTTIAFYFVENLPHLTILSCVQDRHARNLKKIPSWVPDFSCVSNEDLSFSVKSNWNASKAGLSQSYERKREGSRLELRGSCFDVIEDVVSVFVPQNWAGHGSSLPDGSLMSANILGHFEKIIRFFCEGKQWPYKRSRLEVLVATLVAGHLSAPPKKNEKEEEPEKEDESYFPSFLPSNSPKRSAELSSSPEEDKRGLGIDMKSLSPDWTSTAFRKRGDSEVSLLTPSSQPLPPSNQQFLPTRGKSPSLSNTPNLVASPDQLSTSPTPDKPQKVRRHKSSLSSTEKFPYDKGVFQFRCWVMSMLIAGSLNESTEAAVEPCLGAISQLSFLCPPEVGHLLTRSEHEAAVKASRAMKKGMFQGIESATGVGDFAQGQFSEFDVRWSKTQGSQKMFRTKRGYYGMGPVSLNPGDQVWVICDARVPFVLRPSKVVEGTFELIGETYLHGCMHGEMMTADQTDSIGPVSLI